MIHADTFITVFLSGSISCLFYMQYHISTSLSINFFCFVFILPFFSYFTHPEIYSEMYLQCLIRVHYNAHLTVQFHYNTPYRKYSLKRKQCFKTRKEMMRKNCYNFGVELSFFSFYHFARFHIFLHKILTDILK